MPSNEAFEPEAAPTPANPVNPVNPVNQGASFALGDEQALKQIQKHTTRFGRTVAILCVVGALVLGVVYWQRNQTYEQRMAGIEAAGQATHVPQMLGILREELRKAEYDDVKERILLNLGHFRDTQAIPQMVEALDGAPIVRRAAALALAQIGSPAADVAKEKLLAVLPKTDERDRAQVVWALAALRENRAGDAVLDAFAKGRLQSQPGFDPKAITDVLGPARLGSATLLQHPEEGVRVLVAQALSELASPSAVEPLSKLLRAELAKNKEAQSAEVIRTAAAGLGRTGDPRAAEPLFEVLRKEPQLRKSVLDAMERSASPASLATLVGQTPDIEVRRGLVRILRNSHDTRAQDALATLVEDSDPEIRLQAALGLADLNDARGAKSLLAVVEGGDDALAKEALSGLSRIEKAPIAPELSRLLSSHKNLTAGILGALAATGSNAAAQAAERELGGDDLQAASSALASLRAPSAYKKFVSKSARPSNIDFSEPKVDNEDLFRARLAAVIALGRYENPQAVPTLQKIIEDSKDDARLRRAAADALGLAASTEDLRAVLAILQDTSVEEPVRRAYARALSQKPRPELGKELLSLTRSDAPIEVQYSAAIALGYTADPALDAEIYQLLTTPKTQRLGAIAVLLGGTEPQAKQLLKLLGEDRDLREILQEMVLGDDNDWFHKLSPELFDNGQVVRRLRVAEILKDGDKDQHYAYAWNEFTQRLKGGSLNTNDATPRFVREKLFALLVGKDPEAARLVAKALASMMERGLLIAARDQGGPSAQIARTVLREAEEVE